MDRLGRKVMGRVLLFLTLFSLFASPLALGDETINFSTDLNVINYPIQVPLDYTSYDFLQDLRVSGDVVSIQRFERTKGIFQTTTWDEDALSPVGIEFSINNEDAYFVYTKESFSFEFSGDRNCVIINLKSGYNLVGFPCSDGPTAFDLLQQLGESKIEEIRRYDPVSGTYEHAYWDTGNPAGDDFILSHGEGYQVVMLDDATYPSGPDSPTNLTGYPGDNKVAIVWLPSEGFTLTGYNVYQGDTSGGPYTKLNTEPVSHPSYSDETAVNGTPYYYVVTAVGITGAESAYSNEIEVTPFTTGRPTSVGGTLDGVNYVWTLAESPYIITSGTTLLSYATLIIEPGVEVRFDGNYSFNIYGNVQAIGSHANPIVFTSNKATPVRGDWAGINIVENDVSSVFKHCHVEYAAIGLDIAWGSPTISHCTIQQCNDRGINLISTADALIEYCTIRNNRYYGIVVNWESDAIICCNTITANQDGIYVARSAPTIMENAIQSNTRYGIFVELLGNPEISDNVIASNGSYGIYLHGDNKFQNNPGPVINGNTMSGNGYGYDLYLRDYGGDRIDDVIDATGNWWGTTNPRTIGARIYDYNDATGEGAVVDYRGFLDNAGGSPVPGNYVIAQRLTTDTTWTEAASPYIVLGRVTISSGVTLTIEAGVEVQFAGLYYIFNYGKLLANGTDSNGIIFTSDKTTPAKGDWGGVNFYEGSEDTSMLSYCTVEYADTYGIYVTAASPTVSHCLIQECDDRGIHLTNGSQATVFASTIQNNRYYGIVVTGGSDAIIDGNTITSNGYYDGIYVESSSPTITGNDIQSNRYGLYIRYASSPQVTGNTIVNNNSYGIYLQGNNSSSLQNPIPVITGNSIYGNRTYDLYCWDFMGDRIGIVINATGNWWGTADPSTIGSRIHDYSDNTGECPVVDYRSFLNSEGGTPVTGNHVLAQTLAGNTTWNVASSPYTILGRIVVPEGVTLTIEPGTELRFAGMYYLQVYGELLALGNETDRIVFTSDKSTPVKGDWGGIYFYEGSEDTSMLSYCTVEYADTYGIYVRVASPTVSHCLIQECDDRGIYLTNGSQATILACTIQNNRYYGIVVDGGAEPTIDGNTITGNGYYDGIHVNAASPTITGNDIQSNGRYGLYILNASSPQITGNTIANNNGYGIYLKGNNTSSLQNPTPVITGNNIYGNRTYDLYTWDFVGNRTSILINATGNWWGTADSGTIGSRIYDYNDNPGEGPVVDYCSFLDSEGGSPATGNYVLAQTLAGDTTWSASLSPYIILGRIIVPEGVTLTIEPGTEIRFAGMYYLQIYGKLSAQGNETDIILFTSNKSSPAKGDWGGIYFYDESDDTSVISYTTVQYGDDHSVYCANASPSFSHMAIREGDNIGLYLTSVSEPTISECSFENNRNYGVYMDNSSDAFISNCGFTGNRDAIYMINSSPWIDGCTIQSNTRYGIHIRTNTAPSITGTTIINNTSYGIYLQGNNDVFYNPRPVINGNTIYGNHSTYDLYTWDFGGDRLDIQVDTTGNWWGTANPRTIGSRIHDYNDNTNEGPVVNYLGFLDGAGGSPVPGNFFLAHRVYADTTWEAIQSPYILLGRVVVINGVELTVEPGVEVQVTGPYYLLVHGKLTSVGTAGSEIWFTSDKYNPGRDDWKGIIFYDDSDDSEISYTTVEYATIGVDCRIASPSVTNSVIAHCGDKGIYLNDESLSAIEGNRFYDNYNYALYIEDASDAIVRGNVIAETVRYDGINIRLSSPLVENNVIENNGRYGIYVYINSNPDIIGNTIVNNSNNYGIYFQGDNNVANNPEPILNGNNIFGNKNFDLYTLYYGSPGSTTLDATGNWWGTDDPNVIESRIYHNPDNLTQSPVVDFSLYASTGVGVAQVYDVLIDDFVFSPDGNGIQDQVSVSGSITRTADWTITIRDENYDVVRVYSGSGTSFTQIWDGKDSGGAYVADGLYTIYISADDSSGPGLARMLDVEIDNTVPVADINDSFNGATLEKIIEVLGSADDLHLTEYELEYGEGATPAIWTRIGSIGNTTVDNDLLETWLTNDTTTDTAYFTNGTYTLRLTVRDDAGNEGIDTALITLDNLYISDISRTPSTIDIYQGQTADISFTINRPATVTLKIYPEWEGTEGDLVTEVVQAFGASGSYTLSWDGTDTGGDTVEDEAYIYILEAEAGPQTDAYLPPGGHLVGGGSGSPDPSYNPYVNDYWRMTYNHYSGPGRVSMQVTPSGQSAFWVFHMQPFEVGNHLFVWDGRGSDGNILTVTSNVYFPAPTTMRPNYIITTGAVPTITGQSPYVEVKSDPHLITCSYGQFTRFLYNIDQDCDVTIKILPPGVSDPNSGEAIVLVDNELQTAGDHEVSGWSPKDTSDPNGNSFLIEEDGAYMLSIEATNPQTGYSSLWRAVLNMNQ